MPDFCIAVPVEGQHLCLGPPLAMWGRAILTSPGFKHCPSCGMGIPNSDPRTWCLSCLGEAQLKEHCLIYRLFKKRTQVGWDLHLKCHLLEQASRHDLVLMPSSGYRSLLDTESAAASLIRAGASLKRCRSHSPSSSPKKSHKTNHEHYRLWGDSSASPKKSADQHGTGSGAWDGLSTSDAPLVLRREGRNPVLATLVPASRRPLSLVLMELC